MVMVTYRCVNDGRPTTVWHGITHDYLLRRCAQAPPEEAAAMSAAASLMVAGECTAEEWTAAERALVAVEARLMAAWEAQHGAAPRNRHGQYAGGRHPGLA